MLVDEVTILIKAGNGGNGSASLKRNAQTAKGGPDGGNGGNGGDVYLQGVDDITALQTFRYKKEIKAEDGVNGGKKNLYGRNGKDNIVNVPFGTLALDLSNNTKLEVYDTSEKILIAKGGRGGRGNNEFKTATNQTPTFAEKGESGEVKKVKLELKLIADIGLIGLPNSGKSSLLAVLTNANPKIGNYPFTTLEPNLGVMDGLVIADIPGLIEGASKGKGLGDRFLKHVERTKLVAHCIDSTSLDLVKGYETVRKELNDYNPELLNKKEFITITKSDLIDEKMKTKIKKEFPNAVFVSIYNDEELTEFKNFIVKLLK